MSEPETRLPLREVDHVARLARLDLEPEERECFALQLGSVLEYVGRLAEVPVEGVPSTLQAPANVLREDEPAAGLGPEVALANAPDRQGDYFRIPRILEED